MASIWNAEVCVIGGGPAGISAALAAAEQGLRVILLEARPGLGGFYELAPGRTMRRVSRSTREPRGWHGSSWICRMSGCLRTRSMNGFYSDNLITAIQVGSGTGRLR